MLKTSLTRLDKLMKTPKLPYFPTLNDVNERTNAWKQIQDSAFSVQEHIPKSSNLPLSVFLEFIQNFSSSLV